MLRLNESKSMVDSLIDEMPVAGLGTIRRTKGDLQVIDVDIPLKHITKAISSLSRKQIGSSKTDDLGWVALVAFGSDDGITLDYKVGFGPEHAQRDPERMLSIFFPKSICSQYEN